MILSGRMIRELKIIEPHYRRTRINTEIGEFTYGEGPCGYDIRIDQDMCLPPNGFMLGSSKEKFRMPSNVVGFVCDKSSWARRGICIQNTIIEPGWRGYLTLELTNRQNFNMTVREGLPIAQVVFHWIEGIVDAYDGKYQDQPRGPQAPL